MIKLFFFGSRFEKCVPSLNETSDQHVLFLA